MFVDYIPDMCGTVGSLAVADILLAFHLSEMQDFRWPGLVAEVSLQSDRHCPWINTWHQRTSLSFQPGYFYQFFNHMICRVWKRKQVLQEPPII